MLWKRSFREPSAERKRCLEPHRNNSLRTLPGRCRQPGWRSLKDRERHP